MTNEEFEAYQERLRRRPRAGTGHPLKDALVNSITVSPLDDPDAGRFGRRGTTALPDVEAVGAGQEIGLHREIMKECRRRGWVYVYHDPTRRTGATLGCPDFIIYAQNGVVVNIECKTRAGKLSADQVKFKAAVELLGHEYLVVRSLKAFLRIAEGRARNAKGAKVEIEIRKCSGCKRNFYAANLKPLFGGAFCQGCLDNAQVEDID